jgi:hypothetical protein
MKRRGARPHPGSGSGSIKRDGSSPTTLYEVKTVNRAHSLSGHDLKRLYLQAIQQDREPVYLVHFLDAGITAEIRFSTEAPDRWHVRD